MIDDMTLRKLQPQTQAGYIRAVRKLTQFLGRAPDTASTEDLRMIQKHLVETGETTLDRPQAMSAWRRCVCQRNCLWYSASTMCVGCWSARPTSTACAVITVMKIVSPTTPAVIGTAPSAVAAKPSGGLKSPHGDCSVRLLFKRLSAFRGRDRQLEAMRRAGVINYPARG